MNRLTGAQKLFAEKLGIKPQTYARARRELIAEQRAAARARKQRNAKAHGEKSESNNT
jgi:hypothetical protein